MMKNAEKLLGLIQKFEALYVGSDASAKVNLSNPETGDPSDVDLVFSRAARGRPAGLYVIGTGGGTPARLVESVPGIRARAAFHLRGLAAELDRVIGITEHESENGIAELENFFELRERALYALIEAGS